MSELKTEIKFDQSDLNRLKEEFDVEIRNEKDLQEFITNCIDFALNPPSNSFAIQGALQMGMSIGRRG